MGSSLLFQMATRSGLKSVGLRSMYWSCTCMSCMRAGMIFAYSLPKPPFKSFSVMQRRLYLKFILAARFFSEHSPRRKRNA